MALWQSLLAWRLEGMVKCGREAIQSAPHQAWPSSWISTPSIFPGQGAPPSYSHTGSLARRCHQTARSRASAGARGDSWHRGGCCAAWHSGLADLWGWGDIALALGLHEEKVLATLPLTLTSSQHSTQASRASATHCSRPPAERTGTLSVPYTVLTFRWYRVIKSQIKVFELKTVQDDEICWKKVISPFISLQSHNIERSQSLVV